LVDYYEKNVKKKNKKKPKPKKKKGKKMSKLRESFDRPTPPINHGVDKWLDSVDKLKKGLKHPTDDSPPEDDEAPPDDELDGDGDEDMPDEDMPDDDEGEEGDHPLDEPFDSDSDDEEPPPSDDEVPTDLGKPPMKKPLLGDKFGTPSKSVPSFREWVQYREKKQR
jgi:hypothetical protein